jgi:hypothetical protein
LNETKKIFKNKGKSHINVPYQKLISLSREPAVLANKNRELTVSTNLVQVENQRQARICQ